MIPSPDSEEEEAKKNLKLFIPAPNEFNKDQITKSSQIQLEFSLNSDF